MATLTQDQTREEIKAGKINVTQLFINKMELQKSIGDDTLKRFLSSSFAQFTGSLLRIINSQIDSITQQKAVLLAKQKRKIIDIYQSVEKFLRENNEEKSRNAYANLVQQLDDLLDLFKSE